MIRGHNFTLKIPGVGFARLFLGMTCLSQGSPLFWLMCHKKFVEEVQSATKVHISYYFLCFWTPFECHKEWCEVPDAALVPLFKEAWCRPSKWFPQGRFCASQNQQLHKLNFWTVYRNTIKCTHSSESHSKCIYIHFNAYRVHDQYPSGHSVIKAFIKTNLDTLSVLTPVKSHPILTWNIFQIQGGTSFKFGPIGQKTCFKRGIKLFY